MGKRDLSRRRVLDLGLSAAAATAIPAAAHAADGRLMGPQRGDALVVVGDILKSPLRPGDLRRGAAPLLAWPMDVATGLVRDGARFNQILVLRLQGDRDESHGGALVAFTAVCTHAGCIVSAWRATDRLLLCPCHGSEYDPARGAAVVAGPAPMPLASLPVDVANGLIVVAGIFSGPIGGHSGRSD